MIIMQQPPQCPILSNRQNIAHGSLYLNLEQAMAAMNQELMQTIEGNHVRATEYGDRMQKAKCNSNTDAINQNFVEAF